MTHAVPSATAESHDTSGGSWLPSRRTCTLALACLVHCMHTVKSLSLRQKFNMSTRKRRAITLEMMRSIIELIEKIDSIRHLTRV